jgi:hypothetical protein
MKSNKKAPAKKATAPAKANKPAVERIEKNEIVKPRPGGLTARVWEISEKLTASLKRTATRAEVMEAAAKEKIQPGTAATQYGYWRRFNGIKGRVSLPKAPKAAKAPKVAAPKAPAKKAAPKAPAAPKPPVAPKAPVAPVAPAPAAS